MWTKFFNDPDTQSFQLGGTPKVKLLANGKTAQTTLEGVLGELEAKVEQLGDDLAGQDAQAFLAHSEFLKQKFGAKQP